MKELSSYDYFIFDCDGVILDSNRLKTQAFRDTLQNEPADKVDDLIKFHVSNGGVTRQKKFEYFFYELMQNKNKNLVMDACNKFGEICYKLLLNADLVPGVREFLNCISIPKHIVTGGSEVEVRNVLHHKSMLNLFNNVLGNPNSKDFNMSKLKDLGVFSGRGLYFGDSKLDYELSKKYGLDFVFISGYSEWSDGKEFCDNAAINSYLDFEELMV